MKRNNSEDRPELLARIRRSRLSPPLAIGCAVFLAALGAAALVLASGPASSNAKKQVTPAQELFAVVNSDGTLARGSAASSATLSADFGPGTYEVIFNQDVTGCAYVASLGLSTPGITLPGEIQTVNRNGNADGVFVATYNSSGQPADRGFHLLVGCSTASAAP